MNCIDMLFREFPNIRTQNLTLRKITVRDLDEVFALYNSPDIQRFQTNYHYSHQDLVNYILTQDDSFVRKEKIMWGIERVSDKAFIGTRVLYCDDNSGFVEIQGDTKKEFWRKGLTKEAYGGIIDFLRQCKVKGIYAKVQQENGNAIRLMESLSFDRFKSYVNNDGLGFFEYRKILDA